MMRSAARFLKKPWSGRARRSPSNPARTRRSASHSPLTFAASLTKLRTTTTALSVTLIKEDTIAIGAPDDTVPDVIGRGKVQAGRIEMYFDNYTATLTPR